MKTTKLGRPLIARLFIRVHETSHLLNVYVAGMFNHANPVLPRLHLECEHEAYTSGRRWLKDIWNAVYAIF